MAKTRKGEKKIRGRMVFQDVREGELGTASAMRWDGKEVQLRADEIRLVMKTARFKGFEPGRVVGPTPETIARRVHGGTAIYLWD